MPASRGNCARLDCGRARCAGHERECREPLDVRPARCSTCAGGERIVSAGIHAAADRQVELGLLIERVCLALRTVSVHAHELTPEQRSEVHEAVELFVDRDMALRGFRRVEELHELFPDGDVPFVPK